MTTDNPESQAERRRVLLQDADVRKQQKQAEASTYLDQHHSELGGRFAVTQRVTVVGRPSPPPPPLPPTSPWAGPDPVPDEPPTGYAIDAMPELEPSTPAALPVEETGDPTSGDAALSPDLLDDVEQRFGVGSPSPTHTHAGHSPKAGDR